MTDEIDRNTQCRKGCAEVKIPPETLDNVPRASPEMVAVMQALTWNRGVDRAPDFSTLPSAEEPPDFSTLPSAEEPPDPQQLRAMMEVMEAAIARERQPWWRKMVARFRGALRHDEGEEG